MQKIAKKALTLLGILISVGATAQPFITNGGGANIVSNPSSARIGLGVTPPVGTNPTNNTTYPQKRLTVNGDILLYQPNDGDGREIVANTSTGVFNILSNTNGTDGSGMQLFGQYFPGFEGRINFYTPGTSGVGFEFLSTNGVGNYMHIMKLMKDGQVVIGRNIPATQILGQGLYKLYVETGIITDRLKVASLGQWSDYVFAPDYQLRSLPDVKSYIDEHHHLPDVPSASDVKDNGIDVAEMNAILLRKVEELTLYVLKQEETSKKQQAEIASLKESLGK